MAKFILRDARIEVNAVVLSDHANEVSVETSKSEQDVTSFGAVNQETLAGLGDATITMTMFQDFSGGSVDATIWAIYSGGSAVVVKVRPTTAAISATNPEYSMTANLFNYNPISGGVGTPAQTPLTWRNALQAGLARATS